jgi:Glycosyltransferase family 87
MRSRTESRSDDVQVGGASQLVERARQLVAVWGGYLAVAIRYGGPAVIMSILLAVGFSQQVKPAPPGGQWGDVYRYQCFATAFWSGRQGWTGLPPTQCKDVLDTLAYNIYSLPQSHVMPAVVQQWVILHSPLVAPFHTLPLEYPILSLVPFSLPLLVPGMPYTVAFGAEMLLAALALYALVASVAGWRSAVLFALVMGLGAYATGLARFDLVPAGLTFAALLLAERRRWTGAYVLLALATWMKIYPVLLVGPLLIAQAHVEGTDLRGLVALLRRPLALLRTCSGLVWYISISAVALAASIAINPIGTYRQISVLTHRPLEVESVGASLVWLGTFLHIPMRSFIWFGSDNVSSSLSKLIIDGLSVVLIVGYGYVLYALWRRRVTQAQAWLAIVLLIVATGKIFSAQYLMWVFPFAIYLMDFSSIAPLLWLTVAGLTTYSFPFLWRATGGWHAVIGVRNLLIVTLAVFALRERAPAEQGQMTEVERTRLRRFRPESVSSAVSNGAAPPGDASPSPLAAGVGGEP